MEQVDRANTDVALDLLVDVFHDDPILQWTCNSVDPRSFKLFFELTFVPFVEHQLSYMNPHRSGIASWLGPEQSLRWPIKPSSLIKALRIGGLRGAYRMLRSGTKTEAQHPQIPHYYLFAIGVKPGLTGQGLGSKLIRHTLETCDREGMPAYLENSKEKNLGFYESHGFKIQKEIRIAANAPPLWLMWREAS